MNTKRAIFASGCFWGTDHYMSRVEGVISTTVGYSGGNVPNPTDKQVCYENTGHAEAVEVIYDPEKVSYEDLAKIFFETHDPTQINRQGPDIGDQYRSEIFFVDNEQREIAERLIGELRTKGYPVATKVTQAGMFWPAEDDHQDYYKKNGQLPYCHFYSPRF